MHPLNGALPGPYVPVRVTRGALVTHQSYNTDGGLSVPKRGFVNTLSTTRGLSTPLAGFAYCKIGFAHPKRAL